MESQVIMNAFHHVAWGEGITIYFFLLGVSAGALVISCFGWLFGIERFKPTGLLANLTAIAILTIVPPVLVADLGQPSRFFHLFTGWNYSSPMAWGTVFLVIYYVVLCVYTVFIFKKNEKWARIYGLLAITFAIATHWYTGVVMELNPNRELNHTALAPILFLTGAFISGTATIIIVFWGKNLLGIGERIPDELLVELGRVMLIGIGFEMLQMLNEFLQATYGTEAEYIYHELILMGVMKTYYFWFNVVALVASFILLTLTPWRKTVNVSVIASFLVILAIWGMRHWWVYGGQYLQTFY